MMLKYIKLFENYKVNNITEDDIINTIKNNGTLLIKSIKDLPTHDPKTPVTPISIDDNYITIEINNEIYTTKLELVTELEF